MVDLLPALTQLVTALRDVVFVFGQILLPWLPLLVWLGIWLFAADWVRLRDVLVHKGGWIGLLLLAAVWVLVWGAIAPPPGGQIDLYGLKITNYVAKTVFVTGLLCLMLLAGSVQLSGTMGPRLDALRDPIALLGAPPSSGAAHGHGHDDHGDHAVVAHAPSHGHH